MLKAVDMSPADDRIHFSHEG